MSQPPRYLSTERCLVEVTTRTFQGRYFLRPTTEVREIILGVLGRAQRIYSMEVCLIAFASNHWHGLLVPTDADQLASFMNYVNGEIARKIKALVPWKGRFWHERYTPIEVSSEPAAQRARFRYLLSHGVKENLVERPEQWIGVNGVRAWLHGEPLKGYWFDKTREYRARKLVKNRGKAFDRLAFADEEELNLSPLPTWAAEGLELPQIRQEIEEMVDEVVHLARLERQMSGRSKVLGVEAVLAKPWGYLPDELPKRIRPLLHHRSRDAFEHWLAGYREFVAAYRLTSEGYRKGRLGVRFPERCFPPARPFTSDGRVGGSAEGIEI